MTEVYRNRNSATIGHLKSILESKGIPTYLKNEHVASSTLPFAEVTPALCILKEEDVDRAVLLIREYTEATESASEEEQACPSCDEMSPGTFAVCWQCEAPLEDKN